MNPIKVNKKIKLPSQAQIDEMWQELKYDIIESDFEFINLLKANLRGDLYFKGFKIRENEVFDWFCSRGRLSDIDFETKFLLSETVLKTFERIEDELIEVRAFDIGRKPVLNFKSGFVIDGELAALLFNGGVDGSNYKQTPKLIKHKARFFCDQLFNEEYSKEFVRYYTSSVAWNSWFIDYMIDKTYLIVCMKSRTIWILAFTDTD